MVSPKLASQPGRRGGGIRKFSKRNNDIIQMFVDLHARVENKQKGGPGGEYGFPSGEYGVPSGECGVPSIQCSVPSSQMQVSSFSRDVCIA